MFTPIKNFITYIQKNASGSKFFGGISSNVELSDDTIMESELVDTNIANNPPSLTELATFNEKNHDQNENEVLEHNIAVSSIADDPLLIREDEVEKDIFLEFPPETEHNVNDVDFHASEVVVLDEPDLNTSVTSEPGIDPLAIDDYNVHSIVNSPNPLDSSVDGDVLYMVDIHEIDSKTLQSAGDTEDENARVLAAVKAADEQELRSDGSDSGLGSETSALQTTIASIANTSVCSTASSSPVIEKIPLRSNLKRHLQDVDEDQQLQKKLRRSINFDGVNVFYFPRMQGYGCVPSQGGCTLGMGAHHISFKTFSLVEHATELRRAHKMQLHDINARGSSSDESDSDEELSEASVSDGDAETNGFLQPVSPKQRRAILKAAGVRKIDPNEKAECRDIRNSREVCGCVCRDFCDPDTCACSQAGIKCQVDRAMFPCGCSRDACLNAVGRIEFNPARVRTHFIHTIMRLEMENRQQKRPIDIGSQLVAPSSHMVYNNVPAIANNTAVINNYNTIPAYGMEQNTTAVAHVYNHHLHQQHNTYMNHMPPTHPASSVYANMMETRAAPLSLPLPQPHNHYVNTMSTAPDSISLAMSGGSLHYQDGSIYPPVQPTTLPMPPATAYGDILAPYATSAPYHTAQLVDGSYSTNVYTSYHNPHHLQNHPQPQQLQQHFLGYATACSGDMNDYNEAQGSFISLNTPEASSSRLSAINDLLHNNRNTTAALVAISPVSIEEIPNLSSEVDQMQEVVPYTPDENDETEEEEEEEKKIEADVPAIENIQKDMVEEKEEKEQIETIKRPETPPDEELPLTPTEPAETLTDSTATPTIEPKQNENLPPQPTVPVLSPTPLVSTSSADETESNSTITPQESTDSIIEDDPAPTPTETEEELTTDVNPPLVETVSA